LGWYNPIKHEYQLDVDQLKQYISHGTQLSERVAKLAYARSKDEVFKKFFEISNVQKPSKKK